MKHITKFFGKNFFWNQDKNPERILSVARTRLNFIGLLSVVCFLCISAKALYLSTQKNFNFKHISKDIVISERGVIKDRNGRILALNLPVFKLYANPKEIMNKLDASRKLSKHINLSEKQILKLLEKNNKYVEIERKISPKKYLEILNLGIPGVKFADNTLRFYPNENEVAHILGQVDTDGKGISGVEKSFDKLLSKGKNVFLSVDLNIQTILRTEIQKQITKFRANSGSGVILDVKTGEIISLVSLPDYNNNSYSKATSIQKFNNATKGLFELGSVFKILNVAIGLETGVTAIRKKYNVSNPIKISKFRIKDDHHFDGYLNTSEILVLSSNIGSAKIAEEIGIKKQKKYFKNLGLLDFPKLRLPEISTPSLPKNWEKTELMTISFGHGIAVTPLHAASAISTASSHGYFINPTLKRIEQNEIIKKSKVFSLDTVSKIRTMMRLVVSHPKGTANKAETTGYLVGAKTGTAEKIKNSAYDKNANLVSLVASFPIHSPEYLIFITIDHPKKIKNIPRTTAGHVIAPIIPNIINQIAPILRVIPIDIKSTKIRQNFNTEIKIQNEGVTFASY